MAEYNLKLHEDGDMDLIGTEATNFDGLLADEVVMDWLLKLELEDSGETLEDDQVRRAGRAD